MVLADILNKPSGVAYRSDVVKGRFRTQDGALILAVIFVLGLLFLWVAVLADVPGGYRFY